MSAHGMAENGKQEIRDLFDAYIAAFNRGDFAACMACYRLPFTFIARRGVSVLHGTEEFLAMWRANHAELVRQGWSHSRVLQAESRPLDDNLALLSVLVARYRHDGAQDQALAGLYTVRKSREGWRFVTVLSHPAETRLALP